MRRWVGRFVGDAEPAIRNAASDWQVEFLPDPDGEMDEGDLLVDSELVLPARPDLGVGERTRRITTVHSGQRTTAREQTVNRSQPASTATILARLEYDDESGHNSHDVVKDSLTIGRGGIIILTFRMPDAVSPSSLGLSGDTRRLGIAITGLRVTQNR